MKVDELTGDMTETSAQCHQQPSLRNLPAKGWSRFWRLLERAMLLRCPLCGARRIFSHPWAIKDCCPACGYRFNREDGYFLGAYGLNLVVSEVIGLGAVLVFLLRSDLSLIWQQTIAVAAAILLPVLFYPFSRTLWMVFDLIVRGESSDDYIRGGDLR